MASSSSNGSLLPFETLESILRRVPTESLKRFKLTCKRWHALFKDKIFIYNHLDLIQEHFIRITDMVQIIIPATNARSSLPLPNEFRGRADHSHMIHCDGLLLCTFPKSLAVWNPCFNHVRWINKTMGSYATNDFYGIGYDSVSRDNYKILRFYDENIFESGGNTGKYGPAVELYEFKSNSWRTLDISLDWYAWSPCFGVSMKGNMYWVGIAKRNQDIFIQSFDFSAERFKHMCLVPFAPGAYDVVALSVFREDRLSLLYQRIYEDVNQPGETEVWVTNNVKDKVVSWTKLFAVRRPDLPELHVGEDPPHPVFFFDKNNRANIICCEKLSSKGSRYVCVNLYIIGKAKFQKKEIERRSVEVNWTDKCGYMYLPSVVPVP